MQDGWSRRKLIADFFGIGMAGLAAVPLIGQSERDKPSEAKSHATEPEVTATEDLMRKGPAPTLVVVDGADGEAIHHLQRAGLARYPGEMLRGKQLGRRRVKTGKSQP